MILKWYLLINAAHLRRLGFDKRDREIIVFMHATSYSCIILFYLKTRIFLKSKPVLNRFNRTYMSLVICYFLVKYRVHINSTYVIWSIQVYTSTWYTANISSNIFTKVEIPTEEIKCWWKCNKTPRGQINQYINCKTFFNKCC